MKRHVLVTAAVVVAALVVLAVPSAVETTGAPLPSPTPVSFSYIFPTMGLMRTAAPTPDPTPKPTPKPTAKPVAVVKSAGIAGRATWYGATGMIGAVHSWRWGNTPYPVRVCLLGTTTCIRVWVSDYCQACTGSLLIDLSDDAFSRLAPLSRGVIRITLYR